MDTYVEVTSVTPGSQSEGKLFVGDRIISCNQAPIASITALTQAMNDIPDGEPVVLEIQQGHKQFADTFRKGSLGVNLATMKSNPSSNARNAASSAKVQQTPPPSTRDWIAKGGTPPSGGYALARKIAKVLRTLGWLEVALGALIVLYAFSLLFSNQAQFFFFVGMVGAFAIANGIIIVMMSYALEGVFDTADNTAEAVFGIRQLLRDLEARDGA